MSTLLVHETDNTMPSEQVAYCWATDADHASQLALEMTHADLNDDIPTT